MSEIVKEKPIMEEVQKKYNNFVKSKLMMMEYEKKEAYLYGYKERTLEPAAPRLVCRPWPGPALAR